MSYIRSTSNPEGLYIWSDGTNVTIMKGHLMIGEIPTDIFNGLIKKYIRGHESDCSYKKSNIGEVWVNIDGVNTPQIRLSYGNWSVDMWEVTWYYISKSNYKMKWKKQQSQTGKL
jgi:hypothetical protein